jgi:hypothetical protein
MTKRKPSLYNEAGDGCWICHNPNVCMHHIYEGNGRRQVSDAEGCYVFLCPNHHTTSEFGVHNDKRLETFFKEDCQRRWERREGEGPQTRRRFIRLFTMSYLEEES